MTLQRKRSREMIALSVVVANGIVILAFLGIVAAHVLVDILLRMH